MTTQDLINMLKRHDAEMTRGPWYPQNPDDSASMNLMCVVAGGDYEPENEHDLSRAVAVTLLQSPATVQPSGKWEENTAGIADIRNALPAIIAIIERATEIPSSFDYVRRRIVAGHDPFVIETEICDAVSIVNADPVSPVKPPWVLDDDCDD